MCGTAAQVLEGIDMALDEGGGVRPAHQLHVAGRHPPHLAAPSAPYVLGNQAIDFASRRVSVAGSEVALTATEYTLLAELAVNASRTISHDHLLQRVWSPGRRGERWLLREVVKRLHSKLGDDADNPAFVFTMPRAGCRLGPAAPYDGEA